MKQIKSKAVCILGMHRSGTSVLTRLINLLGAEIGDNDKLMKGVEENNPEGFWEHSEIVLIHNKILATLYSSWDATMVLPDNWWKFKEIVPFREQLIKVIKKDFIDKKLWLWKDPRTCILLPLWQEILEEMNIEVNYIISLRNPVDVAASLSKRDNFIVDKSLGIWSLYTLSALFWTNNCKRIVVHYDSLLENWEVVLREISNEFNIPWPVNDEEFKASIASFLKPNLRHSKTDFERLQQNEQVSTVVLLAYKLCLDAESNHGLLYSNSFKQEIIDLYTNYLMYSKLIYHSHNSFISTGNEIVEVYWGRQDEFKQEDSIHTRVVSDNDFHEYIFEIPIKEGIKLRIDPINFFGTIEIKSIELTLKEFTEIPKTMVWSTKNEFNGVSLFNQLSMLSNKETMFLIAIGGDPSIIVEDIPDIFFGGHVTLCLTMRVSKNITKELIEILDDNLSNTELAFSHYKEKISENEVRIKEKEIDVERLEIEKNEFNKKVLQLEQDIILKNNHHSIMEQELIQITNKLQNTEKTNYELNNYLNEIFNSKSWRLTGPFRKMMKKIKR
jgi:hypothetical protein